MRIVFEIPDTAIHKSICSEIERQSSLDHYGRANGPLAEAAIKVVNQQVNQFVSQIDLTDMIQARITSTLIPTLESIIDQQIKSAAKKAVKAEMEKHQETQA